MSDRFGSLDNSEGMTYGNTKGPVMPKAKIAISIDEKALERLDALVRGGVFRTRSQAIERAVADTLERLGRTRLAVECAKLDPVEEKASAEDGLTEEASEWPEY